jgi:acetyl-CoA carboxylase biotin carboxyl carrier protein
MKISEIQELIKFISKSGVSEVEIEDKDFKINIKTPPYRKGKKGEQEPQQVVTQMIPAQQMQGMPAQMPAQPAAPAQPAPTEESKAEKEEKEKEANYIEIKSPMIGTFYRKPSPDKPEFAKVGDTVSQGDVVCVIEAMKLFNEIESEVSGKIVKVLADDASPVEYDQPLFLVEPA